MIKKLFHTLITVSVLFAASANAAPLAYSVNSDSQNEATWDSLYLIDLAAGGNEIRMGKLFSATYEFLDTEGLAFDNNGTLWGVDEVARILFPIPNPASPTTTSGIISLNSFPTGGGNDFGMTFTCDGSLYLTSVVNQTLHRVSMNGTSQVIGNLGANISAIAAIGNPTRLYGIGNGLLENGAIDSPNLYRIDTKTGAASIIGPLSNALPYNEAGLGFDADGTLWAITDRSGLNNQPSQILSINPETGEATPIRMTAETGFESLAVAAPANCIRVTPGVFVDPYDRIPTLGPVGLALAALVLMLVGAGFLRKRAS